MGVIESRRYCSTCGRQTRHISRRFSPEAAALLALCTAGLFLLVWLFISIAERNKPWVCCECTRRPRGAGKSDSSARLEGSTP